MRACDGCQRLTDVSQFVVGVSRLGGPEKHDLRGQFYDLCLSCYARVAGHIQDYMRTIAMNHVTCNNVGVDETNYTLEEYQKDVANLAFYPNRGTTPGLAYVGLGVAGESGEVADKIKKVIRDDAGEVSEEKKRAIIIEGGDALWYLAELATHFGVSMGDMAMMNIAKLRSRQERGTFGGSGDER